MARLRRLLRCAGIFRADVHPLKFLVNVWINPLTGAAMWRRHSLERDLSPHPLSPYKAARPVIAQE
ncbi:MAG: hypothetical protein ACLQDV_04050 [Candidatus Binataceae bacterium]